MSRSAGASHLAANSKTLSQERISMGPDRELDKQ